MHAPAPPVLHPVPFYYLRHGETDWNFARRVQGHSDVGLNARGRAQAETAAALLAGREIATICTSPLRRARETVAIVNARLKRPVVVIEALKECGFGIHEGGLVGDWWTAWEAGEATPEGAEPYVDFLARALAAVNEALAQPGPVLIVGHGGVYWSVQQCCALDGAATLANCCPVWHEPPVADAPAWRIEVLD